MSANDPDRGSILVAGNINADRVLRLDRPFRSGDDIRARALGFRLGGAAANTATALALAGNDVRLCGTVGDDQAGDEVAAELARLGLDLGLITRAPGATPTCLIIVEPSGERTILSLLDGTPKPRWPSFDLAGCAAVYVGSRTPPPEALFTEAKRLSVPLVLQLRRGAPSGAAVDVLVCSDETFEGLEPWSAARAWGFACRWLVVTRGAEGVMATDGTERVDVPALPAEVVDTTGAGDAFAGALVHGLARGWALQRCLELGVRWGALAVAYEGSTAPPTIAEQPNA